MKYSKRIGIVLAIIILIIVVLIAWITFKISLLMGSDGIFMPTVAKVEDTLKNNLEDLLFVKEYMLNLNYDYVEWRAIDFSELAYYEKQNSSLVGIKIDNPELLSSLQKLQNTKIMHVIKENNYVLFVKWMSLDASCGLLYCSDKSPIITESGNTEIKKLSSEYWYYYRHVAD